MKRLPAHLYSLATLALAMTALSSCVVYEDVSYTERYSGNSYPSAQQSRYRDSHRYSPYEQYHGQHYGRSDSRYSPRYDRYDDHRNHNQFHRSSSHYDDHRAHDHHDRRDDHHRNDSKKKDDDLKHHPNSYRIAGGSTGSKTKPKGYHSVSWYKSRGYDVNKLTLKNEKGQTYKQKKR